MDKENGNCGSNKTGCSMAPRGFFSTGQICIFWRLFLLLGPMGQPPARPLGLAHDAVSSQGKLASHSISRITHLSPISSWSPTGHGTLFYGKLFILSANTGAATSNTTLTPRPDRRVLLRCCALRPHWDQQHASNPSSRFSLKIAIMNGYVACLSKV